jgi:tRNA (guanine-N7-)-methyltransferase
MAEPVRAIGSSPGREPGALAAVLRRSPVKGRLMRSKVRYFNRPRRGVPSSLPDALRAKRRVVFFCFVAGYARAHSGLSGRAVWHLNPTRKKIRRVDYNHGMSLSISHGKPLDPGDAGLTHDQLPPLGDSPEQSRVDFKSWWAPERRALPFELEIGSGKGTFLVQQATQLPDVNYLGIEWAKVFWRYAADRVRRRNLPGVRLLHHDASTFVTWQCADAVFRQVHVYFPDPWPKKRHHKRRTLNADFFRQLHRVLTPGGIIRIVTDHDDYSAWIQEHAAQVRDLLEPLPFERPVAAGEGEVVGTNFERKYKREGRPFNAIALRKI